MPLTLVSSVESGSVWERPDDRLRGEMENNLGLNFLHDGGGAFASRMSHDLALERAGLDEWWRLGFVGAGSADR